MVNKTKDQKLLEQVYTILDSRSNFTEDQLFDSISPKQKTETEISLRESKEEYGLEDHESVMREIRDMFGWN